MFFVLCPLGLCSTMSDKKLLRSVYLRNGDIQTNKKNPITDYALACAVGEIISDIVCIQRDRDLCRFYVDAIENRSFLFLTDSPYITYVYLSFSAGKENPNEEVARVTIRGIPLSVEDSCTCITKTLEKLGAELISDFKNEKIRNPSTHKMTEILNGNRFVYNKKLASGKFLPKHSECAGFKPSHIRANPLTIDL